MVYRRVTPGERRHPDSDLQRDDLGELADIIKFTLHQAGGIVTLSGEDTKENDRFQRIGIDSISDFVVKDKLTGCYIKGSDAKTANTQFETMNYLNMKLIEQYLGVSAVRHIYMLVPDNEWLPTISVVEPAKGKTVDATFVKHLWGEDGTLTDTVFEEYNESINTVRARLNDILTTKVRQILASDLHGSNVFISGDSTYTIIDQPDPSYNYQAHQWLKRQSQPWLKRLFT